MYMWCINTVAPFLQVCLKPQKLNRAFNLSAHLSGIYPARSRCPKLFGRIFENTVNYCIFLTNRKKYIGWASFKTIFSQMWTRILLMLWICGVETIEKENPPILPSTCTYMEQVWITTPCYFFQWIGQRNCREDCILFSNGMSHWLPLTLECA